MRDTVRLNFEFPRKEYPYLKMLCAEKDISLREFATDLLLRALEDYEDHTLSKKARKRLREIDEKDDIPFDKACDLAGWNDGDKI